MNRSARLRPSPARIGRWSALHPWRAIGAWLAFVVVAVALLSITGTKQLQSGVTGESAPAENMLKVHKARPGKYEFAYLRSNTLRVGAPAFDAAIAKTRASMQHALGSHVSTGGSADGHSALVGGRIGRPFSTDALRA